MIGYAFRGGHSKIVFDLDDPMGASTCVACGECVQACPTGALAPAQEAYLVDGRTHGAVGVPVLRGRLPAHLPRKGQRHRPRRGARWSREPRASVRERAVRFRLRSPPPASHEAADPETRNPEDCRFRHGPRQSAYGVSRSQLGGSAGARGRNAEDDSRHPWRGRARRLRVRQGIQRRGVSIPEARAHRLRVQQRRPLHASLSCVQRRGAARRHRLGRRVESGDGRDAGRSRPADRRQPGGQSPGRGDVDQERGQARDQADPRGAAPLGARAARRPLPADKARHRRRAAERDDAHDRRRGPRRRKLRRRPHERIRRNAQECRRPQPRGDGGGLRDSRRDDSRGRAPVRHLARVDDPVGNGHFAAHPRHR